jgi:hypothetical protein
MTSRRRRVVGCVLGFGAALTVAVNAYALDVLSPTRQLTVQPPFTPAGVTADLGIAFNPNASEYLIAQVGRTGATSHVVLQRVSATGAPVGAVRDIGPGLSPDVAYDAEHQHYLLVYGDLAGQIKAQLLASDGTPQGPAVDLKTVTGASPPTNPAVAYNSASDRFLVVWQKEGDAVAGGIGNTEGEIYSRRVGSDGAALDDDLGNASLAERFVSAGMGPSGDDDVDQIAPDVVADPASDQWLVVWSGERTDGGYVEGENEIWSRAVDTDGALVGSGPHPDSSMGGTGDANDDAFTPAVAFDSQRRDFLVVWSGDANVPPLADDEFEILMSRIPGASGSATGAENLPVSNTGTPGNAEQNATRPAIAFVPQTGKSFIAWQADPDATTTRSIVVTAIQFNGDQPEGSEAGLSDPAINPSPTFDAPALGAASPPIGQALVAWPAETGGTLETFGRRLGVAAAALSPAASGKPTLSGKAAVGRTLTCTAPAFSGEPSILAISWLRDGAPIAGEAAADYKLRDNDAGRAIACSIVASNLDGTGVATSDSLAVPVLCKLGKTHNDERKVTCGLAEKVKAKTDATLRRKGKTIAQGTAKGHKAKLTGDESKLKKGDATLELKPPHGHKSKLGATIA